MGIATYLNQIKNARLGREVRDAIHDAIATTYDDAVTAASPNAEVAAARGTFANLKLRLDAADVVTTSNSDAIDDCEEDILSLNTRVNTLEAKNASTNTIYNTYTEAISWAALTYTKTVPNGSILMFCIHDREQSVYHSVALTFYEPNTVAVHYFTPTKYITIDFKSTGYCNVKLSGFTGGAAVYRIVKIL